MAIRFPGQLHTLLAAMFRLPIWRIFSIQNRSSEKSPKIISSFLSKPFSSRVALHNAIDTRWDTLPHLLASDLGYTEDDSHVQKVSDHLSRTGMLKITLGFKDNESTYLERLVLSLHRHHGHRLPISHSAARGWFWDVRPSKDTFQAGGAEESSSGREDPKTGHIAPRSS
ncbi:taurine catabolism dioxygenase [Fusarium austroafricanum]|uniref:Taurine catabolism dioxygenase n=1 Tax=Fusarium austroafricanum TaxID=2364996 RepID=A0A8H4P0L3_9HYPO|nr:taurine catabolism dioxygenase [Fusarium austroafricanum]